MVYPENLSHVLPCSVHAASSPTPLTLTFFINKEIYYSSWASLKSMLL